LIETGVYRKITHENQKIFVFFLIMFLIDIAVFRMNSYYLLNGGTLHGCFNDFIAFHRKRSDKTSGRKKPRVGDLPYIAAPDSEANAL
jgi:hypothetical protein